AKLRKAYGAALDSPAGRNELILHAWRVARLERLIQIAEAEERSELVERAKDLLAKETARHEAALAKLARDAGAKAGETPTPKANAAQEGGQPCSFTRNTPAHPSVVR